MTYFFCLLVALYRVGLTFEKITRYFKEKGHSSRELSSVDIGKCDFNQLY